MCGSEVVSARVPFFVKCFLLVLCCIVVVVVVIGICIT